jgi:ATP-dependent RNA helicase DHX29
MAGGKKKKKPVSNPARGFATTSVASKPRVEIEPPPASESDAEATLNTESRTAESGEKELAGTPVKPLSAEEFEKQLEEGELQALVDKHAQKSKRDALRQKNRLETDRRVLRGQADHLSTRKWLPLELIEEILDLIKSENLRAGSQASESATKQIPEEDLTIRLWTLQQALIQAGFSADKVDLTIRYVLDASDKISGNNKDILWGMEEAIEWLARECPKEELPGYEQRHFPKISNGSLHL